MLYGSLWGLFVCVVGLAFLPQPRIDRILAPVLPQGLFIFFVLEVCMNHKRFHVFIARPVPAVYLAFRFFHLFVLFFFYKIYVLSCVL